MDTQTDRLIRRSKRPLLGAAALLSLCLVAGGKVAAQEKSPGSDEAPSAQAEPEKAPDKAPEAEGKTGPKKPIVPATRPDGARPLDRPPQTAAEKARRLSDLYAQLATAENEEAAKKFASQIEQLWRVSGSDTINLLVSRAAKAISDKRADLARKLLDHAVALAPDYAEVFNQRAFLHFTESDYHAAVGDLRRVLALDPNHYKALQGLAQIWKDIGNKKAALAVMKRLLEVHPFAAGAQKAYEELKREVEGEGI